MKTSLEHLPAQKQQELKWATDIILEEATPEMLILFGSYARDDWVEELGPDGFNFQYQSDFDLLAVAEIEYLATKIESNRTLRSRLRREVKTPVSLIAEDIEFINRRLRKSQYFYIDIKHEGIILYNSGKFELAEPKELSAQERKKLAEEDFEGWFSQAEIFFEEFHLTFQKGLRDKKYFKISAFLLHQATEFAYNTFLLVFTRYKPNSHDLEKLSQRVTSVEPEFLKVFPQGMEEEKTRFELLRRAYVNARYKPSYKITQEELTWLAERVQYLQQLTGKLCKEKIASFEFE